MSKLLYINLRVCCDGTAITGVVRCAGADSSGGAQLPEVSVTAASPIDLSHPHSLPSQDVDAQERNSKGEGKEADGKGLVVDEGLTEDDHVADSRHSATSPSASSRMLFVGKDIHPSLAANSTTNRTRDLLTWRLKDQTRLKDLTNKILASVKDQWRRNEEFGILNKHPHDVGASDGQSEAGSQVVERRVAPPKHFSRHPSRLPCPRRGCKSANETLELRRRLMHDLQSSFSAPLPSRIRYRLKKKPSIYTSKKPSSRQDIGVPDIYETEVSITPKLRRRPPAHLTQGGHSNEFGFAADRKFSQFVLPEAQQHVALESLATPDDTAADDTSTQTYIPLSSVSASDLPTSLVYRPPRRPPGSQRRRTSGLLRRPSTSEPHYFTTPSSLQHLSIQAHLPYRRPVSFRYSRTPNAGGGSTHSTSSAPRVHHSTITNQDDSTHVTNIPLHSSTASGNTHPSQKYLPPNKEYIPPRGTSPKTPAREEPTKPPVHYVPPQNEYLPSKPTTDVKPSTEPSPMYQPPSKEYIPHEPPHQDYKAPTEHSEEPHSQPPRKYIPPNKEYLPPKDNQEDFPAPSKEYHPPKTTSKVPSRHYLTPDKEYKPVTRRPHRPSSEQKTPATGYSEPPRKYLPPDKNFGSDGSGLGGRRPPSRRRRPGKRRRKNRKRPTPPSRKYIPPNKEYLPPHTDSLSDKEPSKTYETPDKEYLPPKNYSSHSDSVTATTVTVPYTIPSRTYLPPHLARSTAAPPYTTPTPHSNYVPPHLPTPPTSSPKQPHSGFSSPAVTYGPPVRTYQPPTNSYIPPQGTTTLPGWLHSIKTDHASSGPAQPEVYVSRFPPPLKVFADHHTSSITTPQPAYTPPVRTYQPPIKEYLPPTLSHATTSKPAYTGPPPPPIHRPLDPAFLPVPKRPSTHYLPHHADYQSPGHADATHPTATPKPHYITIILPPETSPKPDYVPPAAPKKEYVPPSSPKPDYVPPSSPKPDYVPPSSPKPDYVPPSSPKPHYVPPAAPKEYVPPSSPKPDYVPPSSPKPDYVPPSSPKTNYIPPSSPKPDYVPPPSSKPDYLPPTSPKPEYVPPKVPRPVSPARHPPASVTTYRPLHDPKIQQLQDFSHPGKSRPSPSRPSSPPVYYPTTTGPGYNELPPHITGHRPLTPKPFIEDYYDDDDDYYYDDEDDDYYYYYDDDDDDYYYDYDDYYDYYYYYDDYDYGPYSAPLRTPFQLTFQDDYDIHESDILEYGYIAGIPGRAGRDYPILSYIPLTSFGCDLVADYPGYYADMEAGCQVFHICHRSGRQDSFLCPNGTVFNQKYFVCDWWYNFACEDAPFFYPVNAAIGQPGVPLHRNAFEPDLRVVHNLPPLHARPRPHPQPRPATLIPHHQPELVTLAPLPPELVHTALG
ncbi:proteoglycan 4-like isoform X1 [Scylla paramamosain]|uniref:proteoglycan 4-like isoform X1 n=1 Tax=Scylla paramamosain TaxID=85552 RepID=UPI0030828D68